MNAHTLLPNLLDPYARLRGRTITMRTWPLPARYVTCTNCRSVMINGICSQCGWATVCTCGKVRQIDGSWRHLTTVRRIIHRSHAHCPQCMEVHYPKAEIDQLRAQIARKEKEAAHA